MTTPLLPPPAAQVDAARSGSRRRVALVSATLATVVVCIAALLALIEVAVFRRRGQEVDSDAMDSVDGSSATVMTLLDGLGKVSIGTAAVVLGLCVVLALGRRRLPHAIGAVVIVIGANITTQVLKRAAIDRPDLGVGLELDNSLPSGHTTLVLSLVAAALLVAPHAARLAIASAGALVTTVTGASTVVADWHRPSDVLAALLVVPIWAALVVLCLGWTSPAAEEVRRGRWHGAVAVVGAGLAGVLLLGVGVRPDQGWADLSTAAVMLAAIGLVAAMSVGVCARLATSFAP